MSYLALARKWRPQNFADVVGQQHVLTALTHSLDKQTLHHAYLFSGTRGVGKTTLARLFAKSLNCEKGVSSHPCGVCSNCRAVEAGQFVDLIEIDAASRTKVEDTRELLDNVQYRPARGRYKIYLIDEVHMLSRHSFNALLKTLEEPPEHVKFLLATTDPQKLPVTVLSRCLQFQLTAFSETQIEQRLSYILKAEQVDFNERALKQLSIAANGSMRDALSLTDQAIALGDGNVSYDNVVGMLGMLDPNHVRDLLRLIITANIDGCFAKLAELKLLAPDYDQLHQQMEAWLHRIALEQLTHRDHDEVVQKLANSVDAELIQLLYQIALSGRRDLVYAPSPHSGFEMTVLRMLAFKPAATVNLDSLPPVKQSQALKNQDHSGISPNLQSTRSQSDRSAMSELNHDEEDELVCKLMQEQQQIETQAQALTGVDNHSVDVKAEEPEPRVDAFSVDSLLKTRSMLRSQIRQQNQSSLEPKITQSKAVTPEEKAESSYVPQDRFNEETHVAEESIERSHDDYAIWQQQLESSASSSGLTAMTSSDVVQRRHDYSQSNDVGQVEYDSLIEKHQEQEYPLYKSESQLSAQAARDAKTIQSPTHVSAEVDLPKHYWAEVLDQIEIGPRARQIGLNSVYELTQEQLLLTVKPQFKHLLQETTWQELTHALSSYSEGREINYKVGDTNGLTPLEHHHQCEQIQHDAAKVRLSEDPNVQFIEQRFGGVLDEHSIKY